MNDLMHFLEGWDNPDLPDGAREAWIKEGIDYFNEEVGTDIDLHDGYVAFLKYGN